MTGAETTTTRGGRPLQRKQRDHSLLRLLPSPSPVGRTRRRGMPRVLPLAPPWAQRIRHSQKEGPRALPRCPRAASCPPAPSASHSPIVRFDGWLSRHPFAALPPPCVARRAAILYRSLDAWLHCRRPFRFAVAPSIAVAVALPSCRPSPPLLVDCCRFHRHRRVDVHPPLLPSRSLCCACHRRPSPSRHPSPPLLVDCCIVHVHCRIAVRCRCSVAPTIAVDAVAVALPSRCPCPSPPSLVDCCLAVGSHCNRRVDHRCHRRRSVAPSIAVTIVAVASLSHLQSPLPSHHHRTFHRRCHCVAVASSIASVESVSPLAAITMALSAAYFVVILPLRRRRRAACSPCMDMPLSFLCRRSCCT
jgi:hypothetical protein